MEDILENDDWQQRLTEYGPRLMLCAKLWTRSQADAEDVVQEAFVRYWRHQRHLGGNPLPLLLVSVRRAATDFGRRESRRTRRELFAGAPEEPEEPWFESDERTEGLEAAVASLPPEQREVLVLKLWAELTFAKIADQLSISLNTAASRYRYALATLRKQLVPPSP